MTNGIGFLSISAEFFAFAREASASARAAGVSSLICDYLHMDLQPEEVLEVESILCVLLDDPSPLVRRAIAEGLAREAEAPRYIILTLAHDQPDIAALVLQHSPHFSDAELVDVALHSSVGPQMAIARRAHVGAPVCVALVDGSPTCVLVELAANSGAQLSCDLMLAMLERAGDEGRLREALLMRPDTGSDVRLRLLEHVGAALSTFLKQTGWLSPERAERILRDARERAIVHIRTAQEEQHEGARGAALSLVRHLRGQGQLTPALILRGLLCGDRLLLAASLAERAEFPLSRASAFLDHPSGQAFAALYARAGLPQTMQSVFVAVLEAAGRRDCIPSEGPDPALLRVATQISRTLPEETRHKLLAFLGRLEAESVRASLERLAPVPV